MYENYKQDKKNRISSSLLVLTILAISFLGGKKLNLSFVANSHFNIITINTVIIGFLFTSLSILLGQLDKKIVSYLEEFQYMEKVFGYIKQGMLLACITISVCFFNWIFIKNIDILSIYKNYFFALEIVLVIVVFTRFILALFNVNIIVDAVRKEIKRTKCEDEENKKISEL